MTRRSPWVVLAVAIAMDASALLPVGLVGAFAVDLRTDLGVGNRFIGLAVGAFFLTGSLTAATLGSRIDALGPRRTAIVAGLVTTTAAGLVALPGGPAAAVVFASALAGAAFAVTMPATNAVLGGAVPAGRRILAVCAKQAAVPLALLATVAAVPGVHRIGDWRTAYLLAVLLGLVSLAVFSRFVPRVPAPAPAPGSLINRQAGQAVQRAAQRAVLRFGVATMLASLLPGALTGFAAVALTEAGSRPGITAAVLALANAVGIGIRLLSGVLAQRCELRNWTPVAMMMVTGGLGAFLMASGRLLPTVIGTVLAFGLGWGWSGLTYALVLVSHQESPGATGAVLQAGGMLGSATGPLLMAATVATFGLSAGWTCTGAAIIAAGVITWRTPRSR